MLAKWLAQITAIAFNRLGQYASSPGDMAYCYAELAVSFPNGAHSNITVTYFTYPWRMARLSRPRKMSSTRSWTLDVVTDNRIQHHCLVLFWGT